MTSLPADLAALSFEVSPGSESKKYQTDDSMLRYTVPEAVFFPEDRKDIRKIFSLARKRNQVVTLRGGGSNRVGSAIAAEGGWLVSTERLTKVFDIDRKAGLAFVSAGTSLAEFSSKVEAEGFFYPPDPGAADRSTVGGNVATNAGGPRAYKYGSTGRYLRAADVVLPSGQMLTLGSHTTKRSAGFPLEQLLVGSEGTMAAIESVCLTLLPKPTCQQALLISIDSVKQVESFLGKGRALIPELRAVEFLDERALRYGGQALEDIPDQGGLLFLEFDGREESVEKALDYVGNCLEDDHQALVLQCFRDQELEDFWRIRKKMSYSLRECFPEKLSEDVCLSPSYLASFLREFYQLADKRKLEVLAYGHAGDGNLHLNFLEKHPERASLIHETLKRVNRFGGTLSGEHGFGIAKAEFQQLEFSDTEQALRDRIRRSFDPNELLAPLLRRAT